jgi:DNA-binding LacI/PurR family transcriptional regulator
MNNYSVTIKDIARILGISKSTVSRALTEHSDVNAETRKKVLAIAQELQYQRNSIALNLKKQRTNTVGVIIPETGNPFFSRAVSGIQKIANDQGYNVMVCQSNECYVTEKSILKSLLATQVDGLLISISRETDNTDHFETLLQKKIPVVFFDRICKALDTSQVFTDNYDIAFEATQYLIRKGCTRIATITGPRHLYTSFNRFQGYMDALTKNNLEFNPDYLLLADFRKESIQAYTHHLINLPERPDAIFAMNDLIAIEMMHIIKKQGLRVPHDIAILGFNNELISQFVEPSLSTIEHPAHDIGAAAAGILLSQIKDPDTKPQKKLIRSRLVIRESTERQIGHNSH